MEDQERNLAITTCILAGQILIENGSNMDRVNDTMYRMGSAAGLKSFQVFTTVTGIVAALIISRMLRPSIFGYEKIICAKLPK